jgi:hypothetical protein
MVIALAGCGGDDDKKSGSACSAFTPCGGSVVGTWNVKDYCVQGKVAVDGCPTAAFTFENVGATGTMTFNADMTGTATIAVTGGMKLTLPQTCTMGATCAAVDTALKDDLAMDAQAPFSSVVCTGAADCTCIYTFKSESSTDGGSYSTSGSILTQGTDQSDYCVSGSELRIKPRATMTMTTGMMTMDDVKVGMLLTKK